MIDTAELIARANACVTAREANFYLIRELASALAALAQEIERLKQERDQFMEAAAARDQRDADMQEIMRTNNEQKERAEAAEARVRELDKDRHYNTANVSELISRLNGDPRLHDEATMKAAAIALARQAQEIATAIKIIDLNKDYEARVREVEALHDVTLASCDAWKAERDAIEAKTIERCAQLMESDDFGWGDAAAAIRALQSHG